MELQCVRVCRPRVAPAPTDLAALVRGLAGAAAATVLEVLLGPHLLAEAVALFAAVANPTPRAHYSWMPPNIDTSTNL